MRQQPISFDTPPGLPDIPAAPQFVGTGYERKIDQRRLARHCQAVVDTLRSDPGRWWTYEELAAESGVPPGSIRTRVSNLRAWGHAIEQRTRRDRFREVRLL